MSRYRGPRLKIIRRLKTLPSKHIIKVINVMELEKAMRWY